MRYMTDEEAKMAEKHIRMAAEIMFKAWNESIKYADDEERSYMNNIHLNAIVIQLVNILNAVTDEQAQTAAIEHICKTIRENVK